MIIRYSYQNDKLDHTFRTSEDTVFIGRVLGGNETGLELGHDSKVSKIHARIIQAGGSFWIEDLQSRNGTILYSKQPFSQPAYVKNRQKLSIGDRIQIGDTLLEIDFDAERNLTPNLNVPEVIDDIDQIVSSIPATQSPSHFVQIMSKESSLEVAHRHLNVFFELEQALAKPQTLEDLLETVVQHLLAAIDHAERGGVRLEEDHVEYFSPQRTASSFSTTLYNQALFPENGQPEALIWRADTQALMDDRESVPMSLQFHDTQSAMYAPLIWNDIKYGALYVDNQRDLSNSFTQDDLRLMAAIATQTAVLISNHKMQEAIRTNEIIRSNLLRQFSPRIAEELLQSGTQFELGGERVSQVTILQSDVRGFTRLSAELGAEQIMALLNEMFTELTPIIFEFDGTIDKYIGDAMLVVFGSPVYDDNQRVNAISAALMMQEKMRELSNQLEIGIGIHIGDVMHGFIGSPEHMEYTVIGDTVNRATRLCDAAQAGEILISAALHSEISDLVDAKLREIETKHDTDPDKQAYTLIGWR